MEPPYNRVVITSNDNTASRVMLGGSVGNLNSGVTTLAQGLLVPDPIPTMLPALTATVYYNDVPLSPQPTVLWELSCGKNIATIAQNGVITRQTNPNAFSYDSNGGVSTGQIGGLIQVSATVLRGDGSKSGVLGVLNIVIQDAAARQFAGWPNAPQSFYLPAANNAPSAEGFYNLIKP